MTEKFEDLFEKAFNEQHVQWCGKCKGRVAWATTCKSGKSQRENIIKKLQALIDENAVCVGKRHGEKYHICKKAVPASVFRETKGMKKEGERP